MRKFNNFNTIRLFSIFFSCLLLSSCTSSKKTPDFTSDLRKPQNMLSHQLKTSPEIAIRSSTDYILGEEDVISVTVWQELRTKKESGSTEYTIRKSDVLNISVWQWPDLDKEVIVRPDGKISFPLVGDIQVEGQTLTALDDIMTEKIKYFVKSPEVSIMITKFGGGADSELPFGKLEDVSLDITIPPGGKIDFPLVGEIMAGGLTLEQLKGEITRKLSSYIPNPEVHIAIMSFGGKKIIVLGEVASPGVYRSVGSVDVLEAIGLAGGYTRDAVLKNVLVIRGDLVKPEVFVLNLHKVLKNVDLSQNIAIQPSDIVYVPRTVISEVNYYISKLLEPLTSSSSAVTSIKAVRIGPSPKK